MSEKLENKDLNLEERINLLTAHNAQLANDVSTLASRSSLLLSQVDQTKELNLIELWNIIWSGKWLVIVTTFVFSISFVLIALSIPNEYKSTAILAPASSNSSSSLSKLAGQFGGLASLAGINLGDGGAENKSVVAIELIKTWGFLEQFILENGIEVEVFAVKGWDMENDKLLVDPELYDERNGVWVREFDPSKGQSLIPSSWELFEEIEDRITISQDKETGLIRLSIEYYSPIVAKDWTDKLVRAINAHIQKKDREEALRSIEYLNNKISETSVADMQSVFYQLIEEQTKNLMLAEVSEEYVFKTISPAKVAEEKEKPRRALIAILGFILGGVIGVIAVFIRYFSRQ